MCPDTVTLSALPKSSQSHMLSILLTTESFAVAQLVKVLYPENTVYTDIGEEHTTKKHT